MVSCPHLQTQLSFNFFIITNLDLILEGFIGLLEIINFNRYVISFTDIILISLQQTSTMCAIREIISQAHVSKC